MREIKQVVTPFARAFGLKASDTHYVISPATDHNVKAMLSS